MNLIKTTLKASLFLVPLVCATQVSAQKLTEKSASIEVSGTSTFHDWEMNGSSATFSGTLSGNTITNVTFIVPVKTIKSKKGKMMDNKAYDALKADKAPNVTFSAPSLAIGNGNAAGKLTVGGVTKNVSIPVNVVKKGNGYAISVTQNLKLSDYSMDRPGFMGAKAGDEVTVKVNLAVE